MTRSVFAVACYAVNITPELALENDDIVEALKAKNDILVIRLLESEF